MVVVFLIHCLNVFFLSKRFTYILDEFPDVLFLRVFYGVFWR